MAVIEAEKKAKEEAALKAAEARQGKGLGSRKCVFVC